MYRFFSETTVHGLNHIQKEDHWVLKLFWVIVFTASLSAAVLLFSQQFLVYAGNPTATEYSIKTASFLEIPHCALCVKFPLNGRKMQRWNISSELGKDFACSQTANRYDVFSRGVVPMSNFLRSRDLRHFTPRRHVQSRTQLTQ